MPIAQKTYTVDEENFVKNIGFKIQFFRKRAGLSQSELAEQVDMSLTTIGRLESFALAAPSLVGLYRIAKALGVNPEQLLKFD